MKKGKYIVLEYCKSIKTHDIEHLQQCLDNEIDIKIGDYTSLNGCPMNFGLDDFKGLCEDEHVHGWEAQSQQCYECWSKALNQEIKG